MIIVLQRPDTLPMNTVDAMKKITFLLFVVLFTLQLSTPAQAQVPETQNVGSWLATTPSAPSFTLPPSTPRLPEAERPLAAAVSVGDQLAALLAVPEVRVQEAALRHLFFIALHEDEGTSLDAAIPQLTELYRHHEQESIQLLAASVLLTLGQEALLAPAGPTHAAPMLDRMQAITALHDRYTGQ